MTSRERIEAALAHREPDRTPVFEYVLLSPVADRLLGRRYSADPKCWGALRREMGFEAAVRQIAVDRIELALLLGHDMMYVWPNPLSTDAAAPGLPHFGGVSDDPVAFVAERNERRAQVPAPPPDESLLVFRMLKEEMDRRGADLPILAPAYEHGVWDDVNLMMTMALEPEVARRHFALATARSSAAIEAYARLGIDQAGIGGDFAGNAPMISPEAYREFIVPEVGTLSRRAHELGMSTVNASDGNLWPVIHDYLIGCEVDGYIEIDQRAGMDLRRLKQAYGSRVTLYGNLDCGNTLSFATPAEVKRHVVECLDAGLGGGHILCASNAITESVPLENYLAVIEAYREFFGLPAFRPA